jgi:hypothetical protein
MKNRILLSGLAVLAMAAPLASTPAQAAVGDQPPFTLTMPDKVTAESFDGYVYLETGPRLTTGAEAFELRAKRTNYHHPIVVTWHRSGGDVTLPEGTMTNFYGLPDFFRTLIKGPKGHVFSTSYAPLCPDGETARARPDAPAHNPYPMGCPYNPFTLGSVIGMQAGWYTEFGDGFFGGSEVRLKPGSYTLVTTITKKYRAMFGVPDASSRKESVLAVTKASDCRGCRPSTSRREEAPLPTPARTRPSGVGKVPDAGPRPDLRTLPAFGMQISPKGNYLQFEATVWNGGTSPMVVDGFRRAGKDLMDAYEYFFDTAGNQTGYQKVGTMEWDPRPSHQHWHFTDFARYQLLNKDKTVARRSQKEAFCLANTDAVDYTLPAADWHPDGTDLGTACGDYGSQSVRESLATGSGDTYAQFRAGQSFDLKGLPNGVYYISVEANPERNLVETSTTNNDSLRRVVIGGKLGHRTVKYGKVGLVDDTDLGGIFFRTR